MQQRVHAMQGRIHRFTVDDKGCVMKVVFGADVPQEDQPYRALHTALNLRQVTLTPTPTLALTPALTPTPTPTLTLTLTPNLRQALSLQGIQPAFGVASGTSLVGPVGGVVRQVRPRPRSASATSTRAPVRPCTHLAAPPPPPAYLPSLPTSLTSPHLPHLPPSSLGRSSRCMAIASCWRRA